MRYHTVCIWMSLDLFFHQLRNHCTLFPQFNRIVELQNGLGWNGPQSPPSSKPLQWAGLPPTWSGVWWGWSTWKWCISQRVREASSWADHGDTACAFTKGKAKREHPSLGIREPTLGSTAAGGCFALHKEAAGRHCKKKKKRKKEKQPNFVLVSRTSPVCTHRPPTSWDMCFLCYSTVQPHQHYQHVLSSSPKGSPKAVLASPKWHLSAVLFPFANVHTLYLNESLQLPVTVLWRWKKNLADCHGCSWFDRVVKTSPIYSGRKDSHIQKDGTLARC